MADDVQQELETHLRRDEIYSEIRKHNKQYYEKRKKQFTLEMVNRKMKLYAPASYETIASERQRKIREGQIKFFIEDQQRQLQRRKGKPTKSTWMFI
jgi:hypothetical protein